MRFQKGQSVVEFALVLPLFMVILWGIFYGSFLFTDYLSLTNLARSAARQASVEASGGLADSAKLEKYEEVRKEVADKYESVLNTDLYSFDPKNEDNFKIEGVKENDKIKNVKVTIKATLNKNGTLGSAFSGFISVADKFEIEYQMYQEK